MKNQGAISYIFPHFGLKAQPSKIKALRKISKPFLFAGAALVPHFEATNLIKTQLT